MIHKKTATILIAFFCLLTGIVHAEGVRHFEQSPYTHVFLIYSANRTNEVSLKVSGGIRDALLNRGLPYSRDVLELNMLYVSNPEVWDKDVASYLPDIQAGRYDLIVAESREACRTLMKYMPRIPEKTSVVMANIPAFDADSIRKLHRNTTAVIRDRDARPNLKLGLKLFPAAKEAVALVSSYDWTDKDTETLRSACPAYIRLKILPFDNDKPETLAVIASELKSLPAESFVISMDWDRFFVARSAREGMWRWLKKQYGGPIFIRRHENISFAFGGELACLNDVGKETGEITARIASGTLAGNIEPVRVKTVPTFNCPELRKFKIAESALPEGFDIANEPPDFFTSYRREIHGAFLLLIAVCAGLLLTSILLMVSRHRTKLGKNLHKALPVRVVVFNQRGDILYLHIESGVETRMDRKAVYKHVSDLPWINTRQTMDAVGNVYKNGKPVILDYNFMGECRSAVFTRIDASVFGQTAVMSTSTDSSRLQRMRNEARQTAARFSLTLQAIGDGVIVTDKSEVITMMNPVAARLTGVPETKAVGQELDEVFTIVDSRNGGKMPSQVREALATGNIALLSERTDLISKDGRRYHIADSASPIKTGEGEILGAILVFHDMTDEYRKRDELATSVSLLNQVAHYANISFFRADVEHVTAEPLMMDKMRFWPYRSGKPIPLSEWLIQEDANMLIDQLKSFTSGKTETIRSVVRSEYNGRMQYFSLQAVASAKGDRKHVFGIFRDITVETLEQKRNEENRYLLETMEDAIPMPIFVKDAADFKYLRCNRFYAEQLGLPRDRIIGKSDYEIFADGTDADLLRRHDREVVTQNCKTDFLEEYHDKNNMLFKCHTIKQVITGIDGRKLLLGISTDISGEESARIAAEQTMRLFGAVIDHFPANVYVKDADHDFRYILWNRSIAEQTGLSAKEVVGRNDAGIGMPPDQAESCLKQDQELLRTGEMQMERKVLQHKEKGPVTCDVRRVQISQSGRNLILGMSTDVTDMLKLQNSVEVYSGHDKLINNVLAMMIRESDFKTVVTLLLRAYAEQKGADRGTVFRMIGRKLVKEAEWSAREDTCAMQEHDLSDWGGWIARWESGESILIDDLLNVPVDLHSAAELLTALGIKSLISAPIIVDGKLYGIMGYDILAATKTFTRDDESFVRDAVGLYRLALEREMQKRTIQKQTIVQRKMFEKVDIPFSLFDADLKLAAGNEAFYKLFKTTPERLLGHSCHEVCPGDGSCCEPEKCPLLYTKTYGQTSSVIGKFGPQTIRGSATPIFDESGKLQYMIQTHTDLSEISEEKEHLKTYLKQDSLIQNCLTAILTRFDRDSAFQLIVEKVTEYFNARATVIRREVKTEKGQSSVKVAMCCPDESPDFRKKFDKDSESDFPEIYRMLRAGKSVLANRGKPLPDEPAWRKECRSYLNETGSAGILIYPVMSENIFWGYFTLETPADGHCFNEEDKRIGENINRMIELLLEREQHKQLLNTGKTLQTQVFDSVQIALFMFDRERRVVAVNRRGAEIVKMDRARILNARCYEKLCCGKETEFCDREHCPSRHALECGERKEMDYSFNGRIWHLLAEPIFDEAGEVRYALESVTDVTEERGRLAQIEEQTRELEKYNRELNRYIAQDRLIAKGMEMLLVENDPEEGRRKILAMIGPHLGADGCALMDHRFDGGNVVSVIRALWTTPGKETAHSVGETYSGVDFPAAFAELKEEKFLHLRKDELNPDIPWQNEYRRYLIAKGETELVKIPIRLHERIWGTLTVAQSGPVPFTSAQLRLMENAGHIIEVLFEREEQQKNILLADREKQIILDTLKIPLMLFDSGMNVRNINAEMKALREKLNLEASSACPGCALADSRCNSGAPDSLCIVRESIRNGVPQNEERLIAGTSYLCSTYPVMAGGKVLHVLLSMIDISEMAKGKAMLQKALTDAENSSRAKSAFLVDFSRRLIQPIRTLLDSLDETTENEKLKTFRSAGSSMLKMLNSVMELSLVESDRLPLQDETIVPAVFFREFIQQYEHTASQKNLTLNINIQEAPVLPDLRLDPRLLKQALSVIVDNAIRYTADGGIQFSVSRKTDNTGAAKLTIVVHDTGMGIPEERLKRIFVLASGEKDDLCVNLIVAERLIRKMGGEIGVQSQVGKGTCFTISFPVRQTVEEHVKQPVPIPQGQGNKNVLIVDDVKLNLVVLAAMLKRLGFTAQKTSGGAEALEYLKSNTPCCVLTDIWMPEMNGVELARTIRKTIGDDIFPIYAVTADAESGKTFDMSIFQKTLIKPVTVEKLKEILPDEK